MLLLFTLRIKWNTIWVQCLGQNAAGILMVKHLPYSPSLKWNKTGLGEQNAVW
jgi:hypothetical protein